MLETVGALWQTALGGRQGRKAWCSPTPRLASPARRQTCSSLLTCTCCLFLIRVLKYFYCINVCPFRLKFTIEIEMQPALHTPM